MSINLNNNYSKLTSQKILDEINKLKNIIENKIYIDIESIITKYKTYIYNYLLLSSNKYEIFITNGYKSYNIIYNLIPLYYNTKIHVIISSTEETFTYNYYNNIISNKNIEITLLSPNKYGIITLDNIKNVTKEYTKFIIIPYSNKELGTNNNIKDITNYCRSNDIIYSSNINNLFGYYNTKFVNNIDIIFATFDKIYGPSDISIILIKKKILNDKITDYINNSSNLLNIKKNIPLISGSLFSILNILKNRDDKNNKILSLKTSFINKISQILPIIKYRDYNNIYKESLIKLTIVIINNDFIENHNTLLISIFSNKIKININNILKYLNTNNIYINNIPINIINNIDFDSKIKNGLLSFTIGDHNKQSDINVLLKFLIQAIQLQYSTIYDEIKDNIITNKKMNQKKIKKVVKFSNPLCIEKKTQIHNHPHIKSILIL